MFCLSCFLAIWSCDVGWFHMTLHANQTFLLETEEKLRKFLMKSLIFLRVFLFEKVWKKSLNKSKLQLEIVELFHKLQ